MIDPQLIAIMQWTVPPILGLCLGYGVLYVRDKDRDTEQRAKTDAQAQFALVLDAKFSQFETSLLEKLRNQYVSSGGVNVSGAELLRRIESLERDCREKHAAPTPIRTTT